MKWARGISRRGWCRGFMLERLFCSWGGRGEGFVYSGVGNVYMADMME